MTIRVPEAPGPSDRSANMRAIRRRDTAMERRVRSLLHRRGLRFRVDRPIPLEGRRPVRPDIVFPSAKLCVELDGCFWHGCPSCYPVPPQENRRYWRPKIARNKERDAEQASALRSAGWIVLRFWEHERPEDVADTIYDELLEARARRLSP